jgi:hypothetical protein
MGQDLFYPPNVAGWPGGRSWLTTQTIIARVNYVAAVVAGTTHRPATVPDFSRIAVQRSHEFESPISTLLLGRAIPMDDGPETSIKAPNVFQLLTDPNAHLH